jgi:predicted  nucleic acid-binding Zn-ribbon protein
MCTCTICGDTYPPAGRWCRDWCHDCAARNFAGSLELALDEAIAPARAALEAYVTQPVTARQRSALVRMHERWRQEEGRP